MVQEQTQHQKCIWSGSKQTRLADERDRLHEQHTNTNYGERIKPLKSGWRFLAQFGDKHRYS